MSTILYIEDDPELRTMVHHLLTEHGFSVETAEDGLEGVGKALEVKPDLILLDIYLPRLDGFGVLERLKGDPDTWAIPVIAISAWPTGDNRQRIREAGAVDFVAKPFQIDSLVSLLQVHLQG
jgi:CheY-like chemotaxis protein